MTREDRKDLTKKQKTDLRKLRKSYKNEMYYYLREKYAKLRRSWDVFIFCVFNDYYDVFWTWNISKEIWF